MNAAPAVRTCIAAVVLLVGITTGTAGCGLMKKLERRSFNDYHNARMGAIASAAVAHDFESGWSDTVAVPLVCRERTERAYRRLLQAMELKEAARQDLLAQALLSAGLVEDVVEALIRRDIPRIKRLAPELLASRQQLLQLQQAYVTKQRAVKQCMVDIQQAWLQLWPECDLDFALDDFTQQAWARSVGTVDQAEHPSLLHYYDSVYTRLAMTYLNLGLSAEPDPEPAVPAGAEDLDQSLAKQEAVLRAWFDLNQAAEIDAAQLIELSEARLLPENWLDGLVDTDQLAQHKAGAAVARLRVYRLAEIMMSLCLKTVQQEVDWQWRRAWPGHELETDISVYAASSRMSQQIHANP